MHAARRTLSLVALAAAILPAAAGPARAGTVVQFSTYLGDFTFALSSDPLLQTTVENFLDYVDAGAYSNSIIHRSTTYNYFIDQNQVVPTAPWILQGGSFMFDSGTIFPIATGAPIPLEISGSASNVAGTLAMARSNDPDSATSGWFINVTDNSSAFDGRYAVFGTIVQGWNVIEQMSALDVFNMNGVIFNVPNTDPLYYDGPFGEMPLINFQGNQYLTMVNSIAAVPEPSTWITAFAGLACGGFSMWRRRKRA